MQTQRVLLTQHHRCPRERSQQRRRSAHNLEERRKGRLQAAGEEELRQHSVASDALWRPRRQPDAPLSRGRVGKKHIYHEREGLLSVPPPVRGGGRLVAATQSSPPASRTPLTARLAAPCTRQRDGARLGAR